MVMATGVTQRSNQPLAGCVCHKPRAKRSDSPDGLGDVVDVLGLDGGVQVILQDAREVVLQLTPPEVPQDLLPVGGRLHE